MAAALDQLGANDAATAVREHARTFPAKSAQTAGLSAD
jgi:hypothetical protein